MQRIPKDTKFHDPNKSKKEDKRYPFDKGKKHTKEHAVDPERNIVYEDKHWKPLEDLNPKHVDKMKATDSPVTEMEKRKVCDGVLHLTGSFFKGHKDEIMRAVKNSEELAKERDVMNVIENIEENPDGITIYTAKNQLAVTLGKKIDSAFKGGNLNISWSDDDKPSEVRWHKDLEE